MKTQGNESRDRLDVAAELQDKLNEKGLAEVRRAMAAEAAHPDFDGVHCIECAEDIPAERLTLGKVRCVPCQNLKEKRR